MMTSSKCTLSDKSVIPLGVSLLGAAIILAVSLISMNMLLIKATLMQSGVTVLFAVWFFNRTRRQRVTFNKPQLLMITPALLFMLSALFNFLFVTNSRDTSLDELLLRIPYFFIFFLGAVAFSDVEKIRRVVTIIVLFSSVALLYGMLQHFGIDPLHMGSDQRIQSTFGNPNFYVGFLTLMIPVVAVSFDLGDAEERKKAFRIGIPAIVFSSGYYLLTVINQSRIVNAVVFLMLLAAIIIISFRLRLAEKTFSAVTFFLLLNNILLTRSRSGQIGLGVGFIILFLVLFLFVIPLKSLRRRILMVSMTIGAVALVVAGVLHISYSDQGRLNTVLERKYYVEGAFNLVGQKPLAGHGIGTFKNNYPLIKKPESWAYNATCFEHVSNVYNEHLEILHDEGIIGLILWIWLLAAIFSAAFRTMNAPEKVYENSLLQGSGNNRFVRWPEMFSPSPRVLLIGLCAGTGALLISNVFSLSMRYVSTGYFFWLFMGFITSITSNALEVKQDVPPTITVDGSSKAGALHLLLNGIVILIAIVTSVFSIRMYLADVHLNNAVYYSKDAYTPIDTEGELFHDIFIEGTRYRSDSLTWEKALYEYRKSLSYNPFNLRARYFYGNAFNRRWNRVPVCNETWGDTDGEKRTDLERAIEQYRYIIRQAPHFTEIDFELGDIHMKLGNIDSAIAAYKDYKRYKPFFTKIHYALANAYVAKKEWASAAESYKDALDLNKKFTRGYLELSAMYHKLGKEELAQDMFDRAKEVSPERTWLLMADVWEGLGENSRVLECLHHRIEEDSTDALTYARIGWRHVQKKEWEKAIAMYEKTVQWDPEHAPAWINLSNLYFEKGQFNKAKTAFQRAMVIDSLYVRSIMQGAKQ